MVRFFQNSLFCPISISFDLVTHFPRFSMNLKNLLTWWELLGVNSNLAKSLKTEESILFSHLKISGPSSYPFYVYGKKVSSAVHTLLALIVKRIMRADQTNTHQINQEKRYNAIEYVGFNVFKILRQTNPGWSNTSPMPPYTVTLHFIIVCNQSFMEKWVSKSGPGQCFHS